MDDELQFWQQLSAGWPDLQVELISAPISPYDLAAASARTCYSSKGLLRPEAMTRSAKSIEIRDRVAKSTYQAGHHTTRQHAHWVFGISGVSRHVIWQYLHSHPWYNSEQVSQRYVPVSGDTGWYTLPVSLRGITEVTAHMKKVHDRYETLRAGLRPVVRDLYFGLHRLKARNPEVWDSAIDKLCMEVARYVMPLSVTAYLYHTVNSLTLYRYARMALQGRTPEFSALVAKMVLVAAAHDPLILKEIPRPAAPVPVVCDPEAARNRNRDFDERLAGHYAKIENQSAVADWKSLVAGSGWDPVAAFDPEDNLWLGDTLFPGTMDPRSRVLQHLHLTFRKRLSHTADSQEQRHRTLPGTRNWIASTISLDEDYTTPLLLLKENAPLSGYREIMTETFDLIRRLARSGIALTDLVYLLPNAYPVRFFESGDLLHFFHKWKARLCFNAQEEIFHGCLDEVREFRKVDADLAAKVGPPCAIRNQHKPRCPEGDKFCGIKVWKLDLEDYQRVI